MSVFVNLLLYASVLGMYAVIAVVTIRGLRVYRLKEDFNRAFAAKDYQNALFLINRALELQPSAAELYHLRARLHHEMGNYAAAESDCTRSLSYYHTAGAYLDRAAARLALDQARKALLDTNHAIACSRFWWRCYFMRAKVYLALGHPKVALEDLEQAIECGAEAEVTQMYRRLCQQLGFDNDRPSRFTSSADA